MESRCYVGCDLGAESGRVILGTLTGDYLAIEEVHRFPNGPISICGTVRWNLLRIFEELLTGIDRVASLNRQISGISVDAWANDYVYVRRGEPMLAVPYHSTDHRIDGALERAFSVVSPDEIYSRTGVQLMGNNTIYQLHEDVLNRPSIQQLSDCFLNIGDYFNYLLSGIARAEETVASTTQLFDLSQRKWSEELIAKFDLPARIFPMIVPSGTKLGPLLPCVARSSSLRDTQVVATCSHDSAAALSAIPAQGPDWAFISSGTISLVGIEVPHPIIKAQGKQHNFGNELGFGGAVHFLKDIVGLWILQECRREWMKAGQDYSYEQLTSMAERAQPLKCLIHPAEARFTQPGSMPQKVAEYCQETDQRPPETVGEAVRCILESLALMYAQTLHRITEVTSYNPRQLHIVGGGSKNRLLNQLTANAANLIVVAGPAEAAAIGNILIQAIAFGHLDSSADLRRVVVRSFPPSVYRPIHPAEWEEAHDRFRELTRSVKQDFSWIHAETG